LGDKVHGFDTLTPLGQQQAADVDVGVLLGPIATEEGNEARLQVDQFCDRGAAFARGDGGAHLTKESAVRNRAPAGVRIAQNAFAEQRKQGKT
jgi:hypothetical protein